jgi:hypothetical protein
MHRTTLIAAAFFSAALWIAPAFAESHLSTQCGPQPAVRHNATSGPVSHDFPPPPPSPNQMISGGFPDTFTRGFAEAGTQTLRGFAQVGLPNLISANSCVMEVSFTNVLTILPGTTGLAPGMPVTLHLSLSFDGAANGGPNLSNPPPTFDSGSEVFGHYELEDPNRPTCQERSCRPTRLADFFADARWSSSGRGSNYLHPDGYWDRQIDWSWEFANPAGVQLSDHSSVYGYICTVWPCKISVLGTGAPFEPVVSPFHTGTQTIDVDTYVGARLNIQGYLNVFAQTYGTPSYSSADALNTFRGAIEPAPEYAGLQLTYDDASAGADAVAPATTASVSPAANAAGWNRSDVTIDLSAADNAGGSGVKEIHYALAGAQSLAETVVSGAAAALTIAAEGTTTVTYSAVDNAGNRETAKTIMVNLDKTPPTIVATRTPSANANGWNNTDVDVRFEATDTLSGITGAPVFAVTLSNEGTGQGATAAFTDAADNVTTAVVTGINIDKTPPTVSCATTPNILWPPNHSLVPVQVSVNVVDVLSGPAGSMLTSAQSSEPDAGTGAGDPGGDIQRFVVGTLSTSGFLRAERRGDGPGRIYSLAFQGSDAAGNVGTCTATVSVPHDSRR